MAKTFYILDHPLLPTPYNHRFFVEKFARGFSYRGYEVRVVKRLSEMRDDGFVMISNHDYSHSWPARGWRAGLLGPARRLARSETRLAAKARMAARRRVVERLARRTREARLTTIAWFWHDHASLFEQLGMPVIFTGEHFYGQPASGFHRSWQSFCGEHPNALSIRFSADLDPEGVGQGCSNDRFDVCYVGASNYKPDWYRAFAERPTARIVPSPPYIAEADRVRIYRESKVSLGLHSDVNIANRVVVERIFESLGHGAACITDNPTATQVTGGIALTARTVEEMRALVGDVLADDERRARLRREGFELIRREGTYAHRADEFVRLSERLAA